MRRFTKNQVYLSHGLNFDTGQDEEVMFLVLASKKTLTFSVEPMTYWAVDLYTGVKFEFHRDSIISENARPWDSSI